MLKRKGIKFQICKNPDVKCSVVERAHRTIRDKLYKYFTYRNTYRFIDVLQRLVRGYNAAVHSTTGMASAQVSNSDILAIWKKWTKNAVAVGIAQPKLTWVSMCV
jgi:transposase